MVKLVTSDLLNYNMISSIAPGAVILFWAAFVLIFGVFCRKDQNGEIATSKLICFSAVLVAAAVILQSFLLYDNPFGTELKNELPTVENSGGLFDIFTQSLCFNRIRMMIQLCVLVGAFLCISVAASYYKPNWIYRRLNHEQVTNNSSNISLSSFSFESLFLLLCCVFGLWLLPTANDLMMVYLLLELISLCLYPLIVQQNCNRTKINSLEAAIKYFVLSATMSCIYLFGTMLVYAALGEVNFEAIALASHNLPYDASSIILVLGLLLVMCGIMFKLSVAPFHFWAPDLYNGTSTFVIMLISSISKIGVIGLLFILLQQAMNIAKLQNIITIIGCVSLIIGGFGGLFQQNIRRLLAYSTVGHMGFMILGFAIGDNSGYAAALVYGAIYAICMTIPLFAGLIIIEALSGVRLVQVNDLNNLWRRNTTLTLLLTVIVLSMAGIPPLIGFFGKFYILKALLLHEFYYTTAIAVVMSIVSCAYYLRIIKVMYYDNNKKQIHHDQKSFITYDLRLNCLVNIVLFGGLIITLFYILYANDVYNYANQILLKL